MSQKKFHTLGDPMQYSDIHSWTPDTRQCCFADFGSWSMLLINPFHTINEQLLSNKIKEMGDWGSPSRLCKFYVRPSAGDPPCPPQTSQWALAFMQTKLCPTPRTRTLNIYPVFTFTAFLAAHMRKSRMHHLGKITPSSILQKIWFVNCLLSCNL